MNNALLLADDTGTLDRDGQVAAARALALLRFSAEDIQTLTAQQVVELQASLRHGSQLGTWETPPAWLPAGTRAIHRKTADLRQRILDFLPNGSDPKTPAFTRALDRAVLSLTRYLLLLRLGPSGLGRKGLNRSLDVTTISAIAHLQGAALYAKALSKYFDDSASIDDVEGDALLSKLTDADLAEDSSYTGREARREGERMRMLADRGLWADAPILERQSRSAAMVGAPLSNPTPGRRDPHLPFPDDYLSAMAERSLWLMNVIAPNVLAVSERMIAIWAESTKFGWAWPTITSYRQNETREFLAQYVWRDQAGTEMTTLPFELRLPEELKFAALNPQEDQVGELRWPPRNYRDIKAVLCSVQMAHYFIVALSMGARASEALSLERKCVVYAADGRPYANGLTYKLVQSFEGEMRDWQLPAVAARAIEQQARLVALAEQISDAGQGRIRRAKLNEKNSALSQHLWGEISAGSSSDSSQPLRHINVYLKRFAITLGMSTAPGGQNIRSHRFRKTLARLVALAVTQAPKILMDVFGHKSIEMTLYYILTDKDLRADIETISRELRVMRAKDVVERMVEAQLKPSASPDLGGYGGLGAVSVSNAVGMYRDRVHRRGEDWGATRAYELAELLTMQGTAWEQVRPGVLCTKFPGEAGPCNKSKGRPEPSKCQSTCGHRLEEAFLREDVDASIADCVQNYEEANGSGEALMASHWAAQVRAHVNRFSDLKSKWLPHPTVQALFGNLAKETA